MEKLNKKPDVFSSYVEGQLAKKKASNKGPNVRWVELKSILQKGAVECVGYKSTAKIRKPWITEDMIEKMEERREAKKLSTKEGRKKYRALNNELRRITERAFEVWWETECESLEWMEKQGRTNLMYARIKQTAVVRTENGNLEPADIQYCSKV